MKTFNKALTALMIFSACSFDLNAQQYPCTVIDVMGSRYGDSMWLFTVEGTTDGYDNGWDGYKMFGSTLAPQMFAVGSDLNNYQVYTSSNIHGVNISFRKGEDSQYTLNFKHYDMNLGYQQLYLLDKKTMAVTDIYADGTQYVFTSETGDPEDRFSVLTYIETSSTADGGTTDGTGTADNSEGTTDGAGTVDNSDGTVAEEDEVDSTPDTKVKDNKNKKDRTGSQNIKVFAVNGDIVVDNKDNSEAEVLIVDSGTGRVVLKNVIAAEKISTIKANLKKGMYIVNVSTDSSETSTTIVL